MPDILGLPLDDLLPEDAIPVELAIVVKFLSNGATGYRCRKTEGLPTFEAAGMLQWASEIMLADMMEDSDPLD